MSDSYKIDIKAFEFALLKVKDGFLFERFALAFLSSRLGYKFTPVGGTKDKGIDGLKFINKRDGFDKTIYQISTELDSKGKIDDSISKLKKNDKSLDRFFYVTSRDVRDKDILIDNAYNNHSTNLVIWDLAWFVSNANYNQGTIIAYKTYIKDNLQEIAAPGKSIIVSNLDSDSRLFVFLRQQMDRQGDEIRLNDLLADSLILYALEGTDPDKEIAMNRSEILEKVNDLIKFDSSKFENFIDDRLAVLSSKPDRRVVKDDRFGGYCLPFDTRTEIIERNLIDEKLVEMFLSQTSDKINYHLGEQNTRVKDVTQLVSQVIHKIYYRQGLEFSNFMINGSSENVIEENLSDIISEVVDDSSVVVHNKGSVKVAMLLAIRDIVYNGTEEQSRYLKSLSNTYLMMFLLQYDPQVATYFQAMANDMNIFVDNSIIVPALSEFYLEDKNRRHWNLLVAANAAGIKLIVNETILNELIGHFRKLNKKYREYYQPLDETFGTSENEVLFVDDVLVRAFYYAKVKNKSTSYYDFIDNFLSPDLSSAKSDLVVFLKETFGITLITNKELGIEVNKDAVDKLASNLSKFKNNETTARNDAKLMMTIYGMREKSREHSETGIFGFKTWWLSKDTNTYRAVQKTFGKDAYPISCYMRPDFIYNYIALAPNKNEVDEVYDKLFPSLLGVNVSYHLPVDVSQIVKTRLSEYSDKSPVRLKAILRKLGEQLKSDPSVVTREKVEHFLDVELQKLNSLN